MRKHVVIYQSCPREQRAIQMEFEKVLQKGFKKLEKST